MTRIRINEPAGTLISTTDEELKQMIEQAEADWRKERVIGESLCFDEIYPAFRAALENEDHATLTHRTAQLDFWMRGSLVNLARLAFKEKNWPMTVELTLMARGELEISAGMRETVIGAALAQIEREGK